MPKPTEAMMKRAEKLIATFIEGKISAGDLVDGIVSSVEELSEKVSYAYDVRLGQNRETGPVDVDDGTGRYSVRQALNRQLYGKDRPKA